jgi:hypothetical protein
LLSLAFNLCRYATGLWLGDTDLVSSVDGSRILLLDTEGFSAAVGQCTS